MAKYLVKWNIGFGDSHEVLEFETVEEADAYAYEQAKDEFESNAYYGGELLNQENAEDYGYEDEL
jgi:hypothetical protein